MGKRLTVMDQLRRAIDASPWSRYAISKKVGIDQGRLSRFMSGKRGLRQESIEKLCTLLKLELVARPRKQGA